MKINNSRFVVERQDAKTKFTFNTFGTNKNDAEKYCEYLNRKNNTQDWSVKTLF